MTVIRFICGTKAPLQVRTKRGCESCHRRRVNRKVRGDTCRRQRRWCRFVTRGCTRLRPRLPWYSNLARSPCVTEGVCVNASYVRRPRVYSWLLVSVLRITSPEICVWPVNTAQALERDVDEGLGDFVDLLSGLTSNRKWDIYIHTLMSAKALLNNA